MNNEENAEPVEPIEETVTTPEVAAEEIDKEPSSANYRKKGVQPMRPYIEGEELPDKVSISQPDVDNGSPKAGDMIATNVNNPDDVWLVASDFFKENYESAAEPDEQIETVAFATFPDYDINTITSMKEGLQAKVDKREFRHTKDQLKANLLEQLSTLKLLEGLMLQEKGIK